MAIKLVGAIKKRFGVKFTAGMFFEYPTVAQVAEAIRKFRE